MPEDFPRCLGKCQRPMKAELLENGYCKFCRSSRPDPFMPKELSPFFERLEREWNQ